MSLTYARDIEFAPGAFSFSLDSEVARTISRNMLSHLDAQVLYGYPTRVRRPKPPVEFQQVLIANHRDDAGFNLAMERLLRNFQATREKAFPDFAGMPTLRRMTGEHSGYESYAWSISVPEHLVTDNYTR